MVRTSYPKSTQIFFDEVVHLIKKWLDPDSILIAGSFGKQSWLYSSGKLLSDFEFVFVCKNKWSITKKKELLRKLNLDYPFEISLKGYLSKNIQKKIISNYSFKNPGYLSLDYFDTFQDAQYLFRKNSTRKDISIDSWEIPIWEAWRLIVNRLGDLLKLKVSQKQDKQISNYAWLKVYESIADAYLIVHKKYHKNIKQREQIFTRTMVENDLELNDKCKASFPLVKKALKARSYHDLQLFEPDNNPKNNYLYVLSWLNYFEIKLAETEFDYIPESKEFYQSYIENKILNEKYLGFNYWNNKLLSNLIRLFNSPKLLKSNFRFLNHKNSWRHVILICIANTYRESYGASKTVVKTKQLAKSIFKSSALNELNSKEFIITILNYWKILR